MQRTKNSALVARTKARYQAVQTLKADGKGIKTIMWELELAKGNRPALLPRRQRR